MRLCQLGIEGQRLLNCGDSPWHGIIRWQRLVPCQQYVTIGQTNVSGRISWIAC